MYILQLHLIPIQALVSHLKLATVDNSLISSLGVFHDKTPLNESNSMPGLLLPFLTGNLQGLFMLRSWWISSFHGVATYYIIIHSLFNIDVLMFLQ